MCIRDRTKGEPLPETHEVTLQLGVPLGLPAAWIPEENLRMALYKRIAGAPAPDALERIAREAKDRFGAPPPELDRLLDLARLRLVAGALGVKALQRRGDELAAALEARHKLDPDRVLLALRRGEIAASAADAFRVPAAFAGTKAGDASVAARAARFLFGLARPGALDSLGGLPPFSAGEP